MTILHTVILSGGDGCTYSCDDTIEAYATEDEAIRMAKSYNDRLVVQKARRAELVLFFQYDKIIAWDIRKANIAKHPELFKEYTDLSCIDFEHEHYSNGTLELKVAP